MKAKLSFRTYTSLRFLAELKHESGEIIYRDFVLKCFSLSNMLFAYYC